jgi:uncharacterized membrane protein YfcA
LIIGDLIALVLIGLFAGYFGGLLGVGGSIIMIPAMTEVVGPDQHLYQAAAMIVNFFVVVPAVIQHARAGAIEWTTVGKLLPLAALAVVLGVGVSELGLFAGAGEAYLRAIFGLFLFAMCLVELYRLFRPGRNHESDHLPPRLGWGLALGIAIPVGLVAGTLGVGGGILAVPLQRRFLKVPIRNAIANSAALIIATSLIGASCKNYAYMADNAGSAAPFLLAVVLIPMAVLGSWIGSRMTHKLPVRVIKTAFLLLMILAAVRLTYQAMCSISRDSRPVVQSAASARTTAEPHAITPSDP